MMKSIFPIEDIKSFWNGAVGSHDGKCSQDKVPERQGTRHLIPRSIFHPVLTRKDEEHIDSDIVEARRPISFHPSLGWDLVKFLLQLKDGRVVGHGYKAVAVVAEVPSRRHFERVIRFPIPKHLFVIESCCSDPECGIPVQSSRSRLNSKEPMNQKKQNAQDIPLSKNKMVGHLSQGRSSLE